ncbi:hypothetical protein Calhy_0046 [Caldicellulosiruptor hydrothermalis 108]|uniref:Uncharacterized protein n=1 Tax=Caldicellulosiruptor hydrothermalis (strain DSM 18901 / VKM B-2411 / 108) TaxID=632292 RepID=E4Q9D7_CALH1|nr:hypothetical protein [Caldicellulosiruptor hydrothermalis]ADQ05808.1 hypothetical protein Calhy_0046 [Caldicellulosiruptor hydrothermalis 108]
MYSFRRGVAVIAIFAFIFSFIFPVTFVQAAFKDVNSNYLGKRPYRKVEQYISGCKRIF